MQAVLELQDISKSFPGVQALKGVSFDIGAGEVHALLGENGAGKSTLIKVVSGVHKPDAGSIRIDGREVSFASPLEVSVVPNNSGDPVSGGVITFTAPTTGASATLSSGSATIGDMAPAVTAATGTASIDDGTARIGTLPVFDGAATWGLSILKKNKHIFETSDNGDPA